MQLRFALEYMKSQFAAIPVPPEDATEGQKQAYAREKVKIDAKETELEHQEAYRAFIRETFNV
tara:strand:- start:465 stop:653 length:189 start_codon:yes stop_codon:yes gene_type:complete